MLINSNDIKTAKKHIEVMQAFIDGKEIEFKQICNNDHYRKVSTPDWDFVNYAYRIKPSEPVVFIYPIYKRLKATTETIVKFTSLDSGIYLSTHKKSIYRPGYPALNIAPHTDSSWEDYTVLKDAGKIILGQPTTIELFEVMVYCDITEEYSIKKSLYSNEELKQLKHYQKTGRSFIIDIDTKQIIKVINT